MTKTQLDAMTTEEKATRITALLEELKGFGKGERASKAAKKIRRNLRALGHYISKATKA